MVLRDTSPSDLLRALVFTLFILSYGCQHSNSASSDTAANPAQQAEKDKALVNNTIDVIAQPIRLDLRKTMEDMNAVFNKAQALRTGSENEKGAQPAGNDNVIAVFEKSASVLGAMFILQGSLDAVVQRFQEGVLDQKRAEDMLRKLRIDLDSYKNDVKAYREMLESSGSVSEKAKK